MRATYVLDGRYIQDHFPGIGRYVFNLIEALARVAPEENFRVLCNPKLRNTRYDLNALARYRTIELVRVAAAPFSPGEQLLAMNRALVKGASLWHSAYYAMPYLLPLRSVITLEDVTPLVLREEMPSAAKRLVYRVLNRLGASRATQVITLSQAARAEICRVLRVPSKKISVVPLAPDPIFRAANEREIARVCEKLNLPPAYVLYLGSNKPHKNLARLVPAWARVETDATLVIAGHWDARYPQAKQQVSASGLSERVLFRHDLANADLVALVSGARAFVFPSVHEGFGLPPLEAMACGTPVACANLSSLPEVVDDAALLFDPFDVGAIADALTRILGDANLRELLRAKGFAQAQRFSWERTARETFQIYQVALA